MIRMIELSRRSLVGSKEWVRIQNKIQKKYFFGDFWQKL